MKCSEIAEKINSRSVFSGPDAEVFGITHDSRKVRAGDVFCAVTGFRVDANRFVSDACAQGAVLVISRKARPEDTGVYWIQVEDPRRALAECAFLIWNVSMDRIFTAAVTGTNGKTTIATVLKAFFDHHFGPAESWQSGTIGNWYGERYVDTGRTTPEAVELLREIGTAETPPKSLVMEVSSHALVLERVRGFLFDVAIFTNLSQDHLDFHKDMEEYYRAKRRLFTDHLKNRGRAVINIDDPYGSRLAEDLAGHVACMTYGRSDDAHVRIREAHSSWDGITLRISYEHETHLFRSPLVGDFNVYNLSGVIAALLSSGFESDEIYETLAALPPVPGRMDRVDIDAPFSVVVDYAHTPDALENVLSTARNLTAGRVIAVFGAGGDRDRKKRPRMAEAVAAHADYAILTSDNPRSEDPAQILSDVYEGIPADFPCERILSRRAGIKRALASARPQDAVIIAGKGHETYQEVNGRKEHFDDREEVRRAWSREDSTNA
ncbi:MAG: UDP-N-acetylmuramoyl-L-alanyl-D-glutamate--2,6-diaminopimelate ligase [Fibrobacterota bacterium]